MNIRSSAQNLMCRMFLEKQCQTVKLHVWDSWNSLIMENFFIHKVAIGCVDVALILVCLSPQIHRSTTSNRIPNNLPAARTTKIDATVSKPLDTPDGTELQPE